MESAWKSTMMVRAGARLKRRFNSFTISMNAASETLMEPMADSRVCQCLRAAQFILIAIKRTF